MPKDLQLSLQILLEHDDFRKSRRALIATSVAMIIFSNLTLRSDELVLFSLKLLVDQSKLVWFSLAGSIYFFYLYTLRAYDFANSAISADPKKVVAGLSKTLDHEIRTAIVEQTLESMNRAELRDTIGRSGPQNTFELADNAASLGGEVAGLVQSGSMGSRSEHDFIEVDRIADLVEDSIELIRNALNRQIRRSSRYIFATEVLPPSIIFFVGFYYSIVFLLPNISQSF